MFKHNKYTDCYWRLIEKAKMREVVDGYVEKHHIIPYCISKSNTKENLVPLTGREHFIAHLLLIKAVDDQYVGKMRNAVVKMMQEGKHQKRTVSARTFELARKAYSVQKSEEMKRKWADPVYREKAIASLKKTLATDEGKKNKRAAALRCSTPEINEKKRLSALGRKHSPETRKKMSDARKKRFSEDPEYRAKVLQALNPTTAG